MTMTEERKILVPTFPTDRLPTCPDELQSRRRLLKMSPDVLRKTTTRYCARFPSLKTVASSPASTRKSFCSPSDRIAAIPKGIESCRYPTVFEKTRTENAGSGDSARAAPAAQIESERASPSITDPQ